MTTPKTITLSCGHQATVRLHGRPDSHHRKLDWLKAKGLCRDCEVVKIEAMARELGLPSLIGTARQVAWAARIRARLVPALREVREQLIATRDHYHQEKLGRISALLRSPAASEWIRVNRLPSTRKAVLAWSQCVVWDEEAAARIGLPTTDRTTTPPTTPNNQTTDDQPA